MGASIVQFDGSAYDPDNTDVKAGFSTVTSCASIVQFDGSAYDPDNADEKSLLSKVIKLLRGSWKKGE